MDRNTSLHHASAHIDLERSKPAPSASSCSSFEEAEMAADQDPFRRSTAAPTAPTLREWCAYWLDIDAPAKRPKSKKEDASTLTLHVYPELGHTRIDAII